MRSVDFPWRDVSVVSERCLVGLGILVDESLWSHQVGGPMLIAASCFIIWLPGSGGNRIGVFKRHENTIKSEI